MTSAKDLLAKFQKDHGEKIGGYGAALVDSDRIPSGLFQFDLASGGGIPRGRASIIYGPESSGKTNLALKLIANHQKLWPDLQCVYFDVENAIDPKWAAAIGVDVDRLIVVHPDYAEQLVDMAESFLYADDIGLVVVDSLAALVTYNETESSADKAVVGGASNVIGKLVRKSTLAFVHGDKTGRKPTLLYINQIRHKIGVMYGDPETMPGGNPPKFQSSMTVRTYGKNILDTKINKVMPVRKETQFIIRKWKVPIVAASGKYEMVTVPHNGFAVGECDDWNTLSTYMRDLGLLEKNKNSWSMMGTEYPTLTACRERVQSDKLFGLNVRKLVIEGMMAASDLMAEGDAEAVNE